MTIRKGTLARLEIYLSLAAVALLLVAAGYSLVQALADRLDPKVRACVARSLEADPSRSRADAVKLCKHLQAIGALP